MFFLILKVVTIFGLFASPALAHGIVTGIVANGIYTQGWSLDFYYAIVNKVAYATTPGWYEDALDSGFIPPSEYQDPNIICHKDGRNANTSATVAAGSTVEFQWTQPWAHNIGPMLTYVANCNGDCKTVDKTTLKFVKIDESGIDFTTQEWASGVMIANNGSWTSTVPKTLAPGHYVFRHETIACHGASTLGGAQNYPFCLNIDVTGSGTANPEGTLGVDLYNENDPGIYFNPYVTLTNYTIPGPALWTG
ncbi:Endoglucanase [Lachnellula subtilissima]|uniref:Endoglucanase n=1 Tax=Lachnellula subtilissima TaxID=602034 RepID=A0A8H8UF73_9HELO|nr:Endoglucanase [Lachnellula subtilissima]